MSEPRRALGLLAAVAAAVGPLAAHQPSERDAPLDLVAAWTASVRDHAPGERDAPIVKIAGWSRIQWDLTRPYLVALAKFAREGAVSADRAVRRLAEPERARLRQLAHQAVQADGANEFLKRAALMHTDIALFAPAASQPTPTTAERVSTAVLVRDGRYEGLVSAGGHWELARMLLEEVTPAPAGDADVARWYRATAASMASSYAFAELTPHLERAEQLFPSDPGLLFAVGCLYEALASPRVQEAVAALRLPLGVDVLVDGAEENLERAAQYFRRVLGLDPNRSEARVRLAHVSLQLGHPAEAVQQLMPLEEAIDDLVVRYFASMFLGRASESIGQYAAARRAYDQAAVLYPNAQSPRLALASLARIEGRSTASLEALHRVLRRSPAVSDRTDPWSDYYRGDGRQAGALLRPLYQRFQRPRS